MRMIILTQFLLTYQLVFYVFRMSFFLFKHWNIGENVKMEKLVEKWENAKMTKLDYTIGTQFCSIQKQPQKVLYKNR